MISDFVKGRKQFGFTLYIQKGIQLHRNIDAFTDAHEATKQAKVFFKPAVGLYAGAFTDVAFDHFLANDKNEFTNETLLHFSESVYKALSNYQNIFPEKFAYMFPYMKTENWLYNYNTLDGTEKSFGGLARRAKYLTGSNTAFGCFKNHYKELKQCYSDFFPSVKKFAYAQYQETFNN